MQCFCALGGCCEVKLFAVLYIVAFPSDSWFDTIILIERKPSANSATDTLKSVEGDNYHVFSSKCFVQFGATHRCNATIYLHFTKSGLVLLYRIMLMLKIFHWTCLSIANFSIICSQLIASKVFCCQSIFYVERAPWEHQTYHENKYWCKFLMNYLLIKYIKIKINKCFLYVCIKFFNITFVRNVRKLNFKIFLRNNQKLFSKSF